MEKVLFVSLMNFAFETVPDDLKNRDVMVYLNDVILVHDVIKIFSVKYFNNIMSVQRLGWLYSLG